MSVLSDTTAEHDGLNSALRASRRALLRGLLGGVALWGTSRALAATESQAPRETTAVALFDGKTLGDWQPVVFGGEGEVRVEPPQIVLGRGNDLTGVVWAGAPLPETFTVQLEAMRVEGTDFFCALTFPVAGSHCTFVVGGWGGTLIGLSSLEGLDASENETAQVRRLENGRWYRMAVDVSPTLVRARLDDEVLVDLDPRGRQFDVRPEMELCRPLGLASYRTVAALRAITLHVPSAE